MDSDPETHAPCGTCGSGAPGPGLDQLPEQPDPTGRVATLEASGDGFFVLRALRHGDDIVDWVIVDANRLVRQRLAGIVDDVIGARQSTLDTVADNSPFVPLYLEALSSGERQQHDFWMALPGGGGGWRRVIATPIDDDTVAVVTRDISRERYFATTLEEVRRRLAGPAEAAEQSGTGSASADVGLLSRSAAALLIGGGVLIVANSFVLRHDATVDSGWILVTGVIILLLGFVVPLLPWARFRRLIPLALIATILALVIGSDRLDHFSRTPAAVAVYPVFFIMLVSWCGLTEQRGASVLAACAAAPVLGITLASGGNATTGWECVVVTTPAAAVLGEVLSWSQHRASRLRETEAELRLYDPLTGIANRTLLADRVDQALARVRRGGRGAALLFMDLDRFKQVNDTLGHSAGDELLVAVTARLRRSIRETDTVARLGGDEFAVLCEDIDDEREAREVAGRVLDSFDEAFTCGGRELHAKASIGIAFSADGSEVAGTLLQQADAAMYRAKDNGRGCIETFDEAMQQRLTARLEIEAALRLAVPRGELRIHYQPVVAVDSGRVVSCEALVRWDRPGFGLLSPAAFLGIAEDSGIIEDIGAWVLTEACGQAADWAKRWRSHSLSVAVNVSSRQIRQRDIVGLVRSALDTSGLDPTRLTLELTESTLIDDTAGARDVLIALRQLGVKLALDDFGTGYSTLSYLRKFPIDTIKIDRSFLRTVDTDRHDTAIVAAIITLADNLGMTAVAEGIETEEQRDVVTRLGCGFAQGFLFSPPVAANEFTELIDRGVALTCRGGVESRSV